MTIVGTVGSTAHAFTTEDKKSIIYGTEFYSQLDPADCSNLVGTGNLPSNVPEPYNTIFTKAANAQGADPLIVAVIFYTEHRGFPLPVPKSWATSPQQAAGPFQFIPSTWEIYKTDGDGDGKSDVQNLTDSAYAAAKLVVALGGKNGVKFGDPSNPNLKPSVINVFASYNAGPAANFDNPETRQYIKIAAATYSKLLDGVATPPSNDPDPCAIGNIGSGSADGNKIAEIALSQLGHVGYKPYTPVNEEWCADFISWVFKQAGTPFNPADTADDRIPSASRMMDWFKAHGTWVNNRPGAPAPQVGDVVYYYSSHVNIVTAVNGTSITVVGGNQGGIHDNALSMVTKYTINGFRNNSDIAGWGRMK